MPTDTYSAVWVSHSSSSDFLKCPRLYYLKNVYKDPQTNHKVAITSPALALGQTVHEVIESLSELPTDIRFKEPLLDRYERSWKKVSGKLGGFRSAEEEDRFKQRGEAMIRRVLQNPGPLKNRAVKIKQDLPHYWLSEEEGIILCGKIDWLEWLPEQESVAIIDFKTGKGEEKADSLQLPIYHLLVANCQKWPVVRVCYWYLDRDDDLVERELPDLEEAHEKVLAVAKQMKLARKLGLFKCPHGGCSHCKPYEMIISGEAELVGVGSFNQDIYILPSNMETETESVIL